MKKAILAGFAMTLCFTGCSMDPDQPEVMAAKQKMRDQRKATEVIQGVMWIHDPRTNLCFAYFFEGGHGGPAFAHVPCGSIPANLLVSAIVPSK